MQFKQLKLENGLEIIAEFNPDVYSVAVGFFVRTGARDESLKINGVSHFLEHMAFKGTASKSAEDVNRIFDEIGAKYNASTGEEVTLYYAAVLPEYLPQAFSLLADIVFPALRQSDFEIEKKVILEEIGMYKDQLSFLAYDRCMQAHFQHHPLGQAILGTDESITNLSCEEMVAYHESRYHASNIVVVVAGATDEQTILQLASQACGGWRSGKTARVAEEACPTKSLVVIEKPQTLQQIVTQMGKAPSATHPLYHAADMLCGIVGDSSTSRMYWELVDNGMAESADLDFHDYEGSGTYMAFLNCDPELLQDNMEKMQQIFEDVNSHGVTRNELDVAKSKLMSRLVIRSERPMGRLSSLGGNWIYRREYRSVDEELKLIDSITLQDIRRVLDEYPIKMLTTVTVGPMSQDQLAPLFE